MPIIVQLIASLIIIILVALIIYGLQLGKSWPLNDIEAERLVHQFSGFEALSHIQYSDDRLRAFVYMQSGDILFIAPKGAHYIVQHIKDKTLTIHDIEDITDFARPAAVEEAK